jgi:hypothetical protein
MVTLMTWQSSGGEKRSCNATCHNAKHDRCVCVCSGRFHGSAHRSGGVEQAVRDTWEEAVQDAEQKAAAEGMELDTSRLRKFIGPESAKDAIQDNHDNHANHDDRPRPARQWSTINRANHKTGAQGRLPLEVS